MQELLQARFVAAQGRGRRGLGPGSAALHELDRGLTDVLYGRGSTGTSPFNGQTGPVLRWYRYSDNTGTWAPSGPDRMGVTIGSGWNTEIHVTSAPDSCKLSG
ncbi:hypothetical protein [Amycolatopsis balhimycina]|uniref:hypothetical protein n=1 Tax=Amycolatopsis balhimycina TaxID=208443 RepID=UPI00146E6FDB|nr:hypothetical protein [Amycolatopsis balhimycina]